MRTIIAGSRSIKDIKHVYDAISNSGIHITEVVSGTANGVDKLGEEWAEYHGIPIKQFPADWDKFGKKAGYLRNMEMSENADALIAIHDGYSKGTKHMIDIATRRGLSVYVHIVHDKTIIVIPPSMVKGL